MEKINKKNPHQWNSMDWFSKLEIRKSTANGSPALCKYSVVYIKQSHIWGISWKIYMYLSIYIHLYMDTSTEYPQIYWPPNQQIIKLNEKKWHTNRKVTHKEFTKDAVT